jgi:two-component system response regulator MprA
MNLALAPSSSTTSPPWAGSTHRPAPPVSRRKPAPAASPASRPPGKRILLVDDDPAVRDSLNDVLVAEGYLVMPAENGQQALNLAANAKVDLALLDLIMPVKNGWDTYLVRYRTRRDFLTEN